MKEILDIAGSVAGIGGIAIASLLIIFKSVIADFLVKHSPQLTRDQVFHLLNKILNYTALVVFFGISAWAVGKYIDRPIVTPASTSLSTPPPTAAGPTTVANPIKKELTDYTSYDDIPVQYGDIVGLKLFEQLWKTKFEYEGNPNAEAKAFLIAMQLAEISWAEKRSRLMSDQRIAEIRGNIESLDEEGRASIQNQIDSHQQNITVQSESLKLQLTALFGVDRSINNPVDTIHETNLLTSFSSSTRSQWYQDASIRFSQIF